MYLLEYLTPAIMVLAILISAIRILREYERGVIFFLGRFQAVKGPGLIIVIPLIQIMVRVDLRVITYDIPPQDLISRDNVTVQVSAVLYMQTLNDISSENATMIVFPLPLEILNAFAKLKSEKSA